MAKGGARPGAGRPVGSVTKTTLEKRKTEEAMTLRILQNVDKLLNAQLTLAEGVSFLFRIDEIGEGKNKRREHVLVTDPGEIKDYLDGKLDGTTSDGEDQYYYIQTKSPDNKAIDSMLDRAFGKALVKTQMTDDDGEPMTPTTINVLNASADELLRILTASGANSARGKRGSGKASRGF